MNESDVFSQVRSALEPEVFAAWVFGSAARGTLNAESDVDVAVWVGLTEQSRLNSPGFDWLVRQKTQLEKALGREVDLIIMNDADPFIQMQVLGNGNQVLDRKPAETHVFQAQIYSRYPDVKRSRAPIERALGGVIQRVRK